MYIDNVGSKYNKLNEKGNLKLNTLKEVVVASANEIAPGKRKERRNEWVTGEIRDMIKKR